MVRSGSNDGVHSWKDSNSFRRTDEALFTESGINYFDTMDRSIVLEIHFFEYEPKWVGASSSRGIRIVREIETMMNNLLS